MYSELWVPTSLARRKATSEGPRAMAPANPPGSKTGARHQGKVGNSGDPMGSSMDGGRVAQPMNGKEAPRPLGSRIPPYERRGGGTPTEQREVPMVAHSMA